MELEHVSIADMPVDERPRERMSRGGAAALSDAEIVALLIEPGRRGKSSLDIARELVSEGLLALARRDWTPGRPVGSLGASRVARIGAALELGRRIAALSSTSSEPIRDAAEIASRLIARYAHRVQETFGGVFLDARKRIVSEREIFIGSLRSANAAPRDVFRLALQDHAVAVIVFHNHPSGDPSPSPQDLSFTRQLIEGGRMLGVDVVDHLVVAASGFVSFKQRGWI
jgi:DNA repair protein RadC